VLLDEDGGIDFLTVLLAAACTQQVRAGAGRAHPVPAAAHVRLRHLRVPGDREDRPVHAQPAPRLRRARAREAVQGEEQGRAPQVITSS
jgi:hypothetical protein